jgi:hypothetical protein
VEEVVMAMRRVDLSKKGGQWVASDGMQTIAAARTKEEAVRVTAQAARASAEPMSVRIHGLDGRIQEERTYPRSADPRRSRG